MNKIIDTSNLKRVLTKIDDIKSDKGHSHAPYVPHGQVIGVNGTLESRSLAANSWTKVKLIPDNGDAATVNSTGEWICPKDGLYEISVNYGYFAPATQVYLHLLLNSPNTFVESSSIALSVNTSNINWFPTLNVTRKLTKDANVSLWAYRGNVGVIGAYEATFSITLNSSIDISTWDAYETWKSLNPETNTASFDDWVAGMLKQSTRRVQARINDTNLVANVWKKMTFTFINGEVGMLQGDRFVAPVTGLYVFSASSPAASSTADTSSRVTYNLDDVSIPATTYSYMRNSSSSNMPSNVLCRWMEQGDYLAYHLLASSAQSSVHAAGSFPSIEFALLYSGNLTANDLFIGAVDNGFVGDYEDWSKSVISNYGMIVNIEYASNDDNTATDGASSATVNRENGSLGMRATLSNWVMKYLDWPTPVNPLTDIIELQYSNDRVAWSIVSDLFYLPPSTGSRLIGTGTTSYGFGVYGYHAVNFGRYLYATTNWSTITANWYWRVVKKTFAKITTEEYDILKNQISLGKMAIEGVLQSAYYVNGDTGVDDSKHYGMTADKPWKTIQYAVDRIAEKAAPNGTNTLYLADGIYEGGCVIDGLNLNITGNEINPSAVVITSTDDGALQYISSAFGRVAGIRFETNNPSARTLHFSRNSGGYIDWCYFYSQDANMDICVNQSNVAVNTVTFDGPKRSSCIGVLVGGTCMVGAELSWASNMTVSQILYSYRGGFITANYDNPTTKTITGKKYAVQTMGRIQGVANLPNTTAAGTTATGGTVV